MPIQIENPKIAKEITTIEQFEAQPLLMREALVLLGRSERPQLPLEQMVASIVDGRISNNNENRAVSGLSLTAEVETKLYEIYLSRRTIGMSEFAASECINLARQSKFAAVLAQMNPEGVENDELLATAKTYEIRAEAWANIAEELDAIVTESEPLKRD